MNPVLIVAALVAVIAYGYGCFRLGVDHELAARTREEQVVEKAVAAATGAAALAISKIKVRNSQITNEVQREIIEKVVYRDCRHSPDGLRLANQALAGSGTAPAGDSKLPAADPVE